MRRTAPCVLTPPGAPCPPPSPQSTPHLLMKKRANIYELRELLNMEFYTFVETVLSSVFMDMEL